MWALLTKAVNDWFRHNSTRLGVALAYYSVFSLGLLLLIVTAIVYYSAQIVLFGAELTQAYAARRTTDVRDA
jgi:uncharacterized BrkB/YihY/UPF0761 family membrane protein